MATVEEGLATQVRNIEARYGRTMEQWAAVIDASGRTKHTEVIALLKEQHGMSHGDANRVGLVARDRNAAAGAPTDLSDEAWTAELYAGRKAALRPLHDRLMVVVSSLGNDVETARKKGYLSLRRRKQFGMIQPAATFVEVGLILADPGPSARLEAAARADAMFGHRVRLVRPADVDAEVEAWLRAAYVRAG